jgi:hypothetical protein
VGEIPLVNRGETKGRFNESNPCQFIRLLSLEPSPKKRRNLMSINYLSLLLDEESLSPYVERNK